MQRMLCILIFLSGIYLFSFVPKMDSYSLRIYISLGIILGIQKGQRNLGEYVAEGIWICVTYAHLHLFIIA